MQCIGFDTLMHPVTSAILQKILLSMQIDPVASGGSAGHAAGEERLRSRVSEPVSSGAGRNGCRGRVSKGATAVDVQVWSRVQLKSLGLLTPSLVA